MSRSIFGWDLPPGVTSSMLPGNEPCGPCEVCGGDPDSKDGCLCTECSECGAFGDPECYEKHGLIRTQEQIDGHAAMETRIAAEVKAEEEYFAGLEEREDSEEWI